ncbi:hypothetical protein HK101_004428 [Irineochytrium annulatum]|nr:hypothetical protein HK101_004428 [Irineochytrium annulatum]
MSELPHLPGAHDPIINQLRDRVKELTLERDHLAATVVQLKDVVSELRAKSNAASANGEQLRAALKSFAGLLDAADEQSTIISTMEATLSEFPRPLKDTCNSVASTSERLADYHAAKPPEVASAKSEETLYPNMEVIQKFPLFASFPIDVVRRIAMTSYEMRRKAGMAIVEKGDEGAEIFFLCEGQVAVMSSGTEIACLQPLAFFGELGRTASVVAKTDCMMVIVTKQKIDEVIASRQDLKEKMDEWSISKAAWWDRQKYFNDIDMFGGEFMSDLVRKRLKKIGFLADAPDAFLDKLSMTMTGELHAEGSTIVKLNDDSTCMYFIVQGTVLVVDGTDTVRAEISEGSFFGEVGVIMNMKRTADIRAKTTCRLLKLSSEDMAPVIDEFPEMKAKLKSTADERLALFRARMASASTAVPDQFDVEVSEQSLKKLSIFNDVDQGMLSELALTMSQKTWKEREFILRCGDTAQSMFFLASGDVDVISEFGEVIDSCSGPSSYFGEVALIEHVPRTASVRCKSPCSTYELKREDFESMIAKYSIIAERIEGTAKYRMQQYLMRNILA